MDVATWLNQCLRELHKAAILNPILLSFFFIFSLLYLLKFAKTNKPKFPPSPPKLPIIGNLHQLGTIPHRSLRALSEKYGPLMLMHFGKVPTLVVSSAEMAQQIMKTHDLDFAGRPQMKVADVISCGSTSIAFSPYGEYWRQVRKICVLELLSQKRVQALQFVREEEVAKMVEKIRLSSISKTGVNLSKMFLAVSNNIVSRSALGQAYEKEDSGNRFGELSKMALDLLGTLCFEDMFPFLGWMDFLTGFNSRLKGTSKALHDFLDQVIEEHRVSMTDDEFDKKDIVDILLHLQKNGKFDIHLTQGNIKAILMDMFVGGTDTTAAAMEWAMAELVKNPSILKKAQEEVRRIVGEKSKVYEEDVNEMLYLRCILMETLRLHPATILRETSMTTGIKLEGYDIPHKARVLINMWAIHRDPKLWDKAEDFIPERFANNSFDFKGQHKQFMPFGGGRRVCPGISFAIAEAGYVLANLLYWFNWEVPNGEKPEDLNMDEASMLVVHKKTPLLLVPSMHSR